MCLRACIVNKTFHTMITLKASLFTDTFVLHLQASFHLVLISEFSSNFLTIGKGHFRSNCRVKCFIVLRSLLNYIKFYFFILMFDMVCSWKNVKVIKFLIIINYLIHDIVCHANGHRDSEICSHWNGRRHFLELGDRGELHGFNTSSFDMRSPSYAFMAESKKNVTNSWKQCNLELVTCAECVIRITFTHRNFSKTCDSPNTYNSNPSSTCPCENIFFSEPPYDTRLSGHYFCGDGKVHRSLTRTLSLKFFYKTTEKHIFSLQYSSERNVKILSGTPKQDNINISNQVKPQIISSPFFPIFYPRDFGVEHILSCDSENCHVRLAFTDFQLGITSAMEIFDSNGQMLNSYTGEHFRPPIIVSTGKSLLLRFNGNGASNFGYRAEITFIPDKNLQDKENNANTDCGGIVDELGGAITMMNMLENSTDVRFYDCIWIIKPANNYMLMKSHIALRVDTFHGFASKSELVVRQGSTSNSPEIETIRWPNFGLSKKNHISTITVGFYVRLKGVFGLSSKLAIVYSVFNYMNCFIGSEFLCRNNRCISVRLHCDGFDHCGDNSDEPEACDEDWAHVPNDRRWYSHTPNYYFPKMDRYPDLRTATGIFIISTLGLILVISGWLVILYRMGVRARNQRELQNHLQTISELLDRQEELPPDEPPDYEDPPDYEEVIKVGMSDPTTTPRRRQRRRRRHSRSPCPINADNPSNPMPCSSTQSQEDHYEDVSNRIATATNYCETTETTAPTTRHYSWRDKGCQTGSLSDEGPASETNSSNINQKEISAYSLGTNTQFEECSAEFRDEPLNVSLSLSIPKTGPINETKPLRPHSQNLSENNPLKKSWLMFTNGSLQNNENRIRQTFSTPESFMQREMNYGSYLQSERNSFLSNASTFGSDLPNDLSPTNRVEVGNHLFDRRPSTGQQSGYESDIGRSELDISCFGHVNIFGVNRRQKGYVRSKSFNQNNQQPDLKMARLKRSSSADLLVTIPFRRIGEPCPSSSKSSTYRKLTKVKSP